MDGTVRSGAVIRGARLLVKAKGHGIVRTGILKRDKPTIIDTSRGPGRYRVGMLVGFYGCNGVLVRVSWTRTKPTSPGPRAMVIPRCPACGHRHGASKFMWRRAHSEEEFNSAMVAL